MRTEHPARRVRIAAVAAGLLAAGAFALPAATAAPAPGPTDGSPAGAGRIIQSLGTAATAGTYYDAATRSTVVDVTTGDAADAVRVAGAVPRRVAYSADQLATAGAAIGALGIAGTAWAADPRADQLVVTGDSRLTPADVQRVATTAARYGGAVRFERTAGRFSTLISGGDAIWGGDARCSLGFNVHDGDTHYFLTAGHCGNAVGVWYADGTRAQLLGSTLHSTFPGNDYALVRYADAAAPHPSTAGDQAISGAGDPYVGERVVRRGSTSGLHGGTVAALGATVDYGDGNVVGGLIKTNVCAEPGDSGGPLFAGATALGLTSGGVGDCTVGGTTFFQPVTAALSHYAVAIG